MLALLRAWLKDIQTLSPRLLSMTGHSSKGMPAARRTGREGWWFGKRNHMLVSHISGYRQEQARPFQLAP